LEGRSLLKKAAGLGAEALVSEIMSIHPECSYVESAQLLQPHILVITNVRIDHTAQMGNSRESVADCIATTVDEDMTVFVPKEESFPVFDKQGTTLIRVKKNQETIENLRLASVVTDHLGIDRTVSLRGMSRARPDPGAARIWTSGGWRLVSLFAANDPESTRIALSHLQEKETLESMVGLLSLRRDRGDRTLQWLDALRKNAFPEMRRFFLIGDHARAVRSRLKSLVTQELHVLEKASPEKVMDEIWRESNGETVLVGMGNMGGIGKALVRHWQTLGEAHDI
jgi:poly-gamma-glutamate synthase PgsB/CapB